MTKRHTVRSSNAGVTFATVVAVLALLYFGREVLIPLAFAVTLALVLAPVVNGLARLFLGRTLAALLVVMLTAGLAAAVGFVIFNQLVQVGTELPYYQENIHNKILAIRSPAKGALGQAAENVQEIRKELSNAETPPPATRREAPAGPQAKRPDPATPLTVRVVPEPVGAFPYLRNLIQPFLAPLGRLGIVLIFTVFLLIEQDDLRRRLFRLAGLHRINLMTQALADATARVSRYLMLQFAVNVGFGILSGAALSFIGLPYAALWGAVAAILRTVPYIGTTVGALLPALLAVAVFDSWSSPVFVLLIFIVLELLIANALEPWLYGRHTGISALALLVMAVFWTVLWGPAGLVLSTPLTVLLVVLGRHLPQFSFLHVLLGDEPVLASDAQLYERLLAMDEHGARSVVHGHLGQNSLAHLYDSVVVPALAMVERERRKDALDPDREEFIFTTVREMIADLSERAREKNEPNQFLEHAGRVICIPAVHESDEISAAMLAQLLEISGHPTITLPAPVRFDQLARLSPGGSDLLIVSAGAPFSFVKLRTLVTGLKRRFPNLRMALGLWGYARDPKRLAERLQPAHSDEAFFTLQSALDQVLAAEASVELEPVYRAGKTDES